MLDDGPQVPEEVLGWMHEPPLQVDLQAPRRSQLPHCQDPVHLLKVPAHGLALNCAWISLCAVWESEPRSGFVTKNPSDIRTLVRRCI